MNNIFINKSKIQKFNQVLKIPGDKSISIRWVLFASLAAGISKSSNLLISEDVKATIKAIKKLAKAFRN